MGYQNVSALIVRCSYRILVNIEKFLGFEISIGKIYSTHMISTGTALFMQLNLLYKL
jgi:hypothetical protein